MTKYGINSLKTINCRGLLSKHVFASYFMAHKIGYNFKVFQIYVFIAVVVFRNLKYH